MLSVDQALAALERADPEVAGDARELWLRLLGGAPAEALTQWRLQQFCWVELPATACPEPGGRWRRARALAALLESLGLTRYAEVAGSEATRDLLALAESSPDRVRQAARVLAERSGIEPPNTELVTWAPVPGPAEERARRLVAETLELAVAAGELVPGGRRWHDRQTDLAVRALTAPGSADGGAALPTAYQALVRERLHRWVRAPGSTTRNALLTPLTQRLTEPVPRPDAATAARLLAPLAWLLEEVDVGLPLTAAGYLPPRTVMRTLDALGWRKELIGASGRELDAYPVLVLRECATRLGLVRRRGARLLRTPTGEDAALSAGELWAAVAARLVGPDHAMPAVAREVALGVLEAQDWVAEADLRSLVHAVVTESGWRPSGRRHPVERDSASLLGPVLAELRWLELVEESGALTGRRLRARDHAGDLFRAALRHRVLHRDVVDG